MDDVVSARRVMDQSLFSAGAADVWLPLPWSAPLAGDEGRDEVSELAARVVEVEDALVPIPDTLRRLEAWRGDALTRLDAMLAARTQQQDAARTLLMEYQATWEQRLNRVLLTAGAALVLALAAL